jgi:hypothetical protein
MLMSGAAMAQGFVMAGSPQDPAAAMSTKVKPGVETLVTTTPGYIWTAGTISPTYSWGPAVTTIATPTHTVPAPPAR